ncbi:MAG TPA: hypothetical protein PKA58_12720 [Polyangium sp.]|nr:hypothetical protein [Polyangium sp.]
MEMIPREDVEVSQLDADVRLGLQNEHREGIFSQVSIQDGGSFVIILARIDLRPRFEPMERTWQISKQALLNRTQAVHGIVGMLESAHMTASLAWYEQRKRAQAPKL